MWEKRQMAFLSSLFSVAQEKVQNYSLGTEKSIAEEWDRWLNDGASETSVAENRFHFYEEVIKKAKEVGC